MQKSTILELSRYNSKDKVTNASWTTRLAKPITLNNGTLVQVRDSFIDCRLIDAQSIEIPEDINLTFQFIYWIQRNSIGQYMVKRTGGDEGTPLFNTVNHVSENDGLPFMLCDISPPNVNPQPNKPIVETASIFIQAGVYERSNLSDYITRRFQQIQHTGVIQIEGRTVADSQNFTAGDVRINYDTNGNFLNFNKPINAPAPQQIISTFQKQLYLGVWVGSGQQPPIQIVNGMCLFYLNSSGDYMPCTLAPMTDNPDYLPIQPGEFFSPVIRPDQVGGGTNIVTPFRINWEGANFFLYDAGFIGTGNIEMTYNAQNGNGKFSFDYMHNPIIDNAGNESVGMYVEFDPEGTADPQSYFISYLNAMSGIMFVNVYDDNTYNENGIVEVPILNQMGFQLSDLIPLDDIPLVFKQSNVITYYYDSPAYTPFKYSNFVKYTTRNLTTMNACVMESSITLSEVSLSASQPEIVIKTYGSAYLPITGGFNFSTSTNTEPIQASSAPVSSLTNSGHFLISIDAYASPYIDEDGFQMVKAIVSNYYFSENFASALEDSLIYQHVGEPCTIQSIGVRILNPATKQESRNLGGNSSVYLQVISAVNEEAQQTKK